MSNIPDTRLYGKSPLSSPVYQHITPNNGIYGTTAPTAFRTLQHPKTRNLALGNNRNNSPFVPAPIIYPPVVMKQGYMTIPRKPRVPSWTPSVSTTLTEFPTSMTTNPSNPGTESIASSNEIGEPVYDNLGLRTTAGGNSVLSINKVGSNQPVRYTMKDRPLPATPVSSATAISAAIAATSTPITNNNLTINGGGGGSSNGINSITNNSTKIYEPIHEISNPTMTSDTEPLYGTAKSKQNVTLVPSSNMMLNSNGTLTKVPPRPPPKPKKKVSVITNGQGGSTSQLFEDECEDGTEV